MSLSLWQLIAKANESSHHSELTCEECSAMLELIIEAETLGARLGWLQETTADHLAGCPNCRERLGQQLARQILQQ